MKAKVTLILDGTQTELINTLGVCSTLGTIHSLDFPSTASAIDVATVKAATPTPTNKPIKRSAQARRNMAAAQRKRYASMKGKRK